MTLVPRLWNCPCTSALALWPIDTIVVTAAMPMTTPSTVRPARSLFLASVPQGAGRAGRGASHRPRPSSAAGSIAGDQLLPFARGRRRPAR